MSGDEQVAWETHDGLRWVVRPRAGGRVVVGLVLARGRAHQRVEALGVADVALSALAAELNRPLEARGGGVLESSASVHLDLARTSVTIVADGVGGARRRLEQLDGLLAAPERLELGALAAVGPDRRSHPWHGWSVELTEWFGPGALTLSAEIDPLRLSRNPRAFDPAEVAALLRGLDPRGGVPAVAFTNEPALPGIALAGSNGTGGAASREDRVDDGPRWRDRGRRAVVPAFSSHLFSVRSGVDVAAEAAEQALFATVSRGLQMVGADGGLGVVAATVDGSVLLGVRSRVQEGDEVAAGRRVLAEVVEAADGLSDVVLAESVAWARGPERLDRSGTAYALAASALGPGAGSGPGEPPTPASLRAQAQALREDDVRRALTTMLGNLLLAVDSADEAPTGFPVVLPPPPEPRRVEGRADRWFGERSTVPLPLPPLARGYHLVRNRRGVLTVGVTPTGRDRRMVASSSIDLTRLAARIDHGPASTLLVDEEGRRANVLWPVLLRRRSLRRIVEDATPPGRRLALEPEDDRWGRVVARQVRFWRRVMTAVAVFVAVLVGFIVLMETRGEPDDPGTVATAASGEEIALSNGTTVLVGEERLAPAAQGPGQEVVVAVRFCGGGPTVHEGTSADARNYLSPQRFDLRGVDRAAIPAGGGDPLPEATPREGQCVEGTLGWRILEDDPVGLTVTWGNSLGDALTWEIDP